MTLRDWMAQGKYLPACMRDFHDQKLLFKRIGRLVEDKREKDGRAFRILTSTLPGWTAAHMYTVDFFLWYMARHGYTLQRSRYRVEFEDLGADLQAFDRYLVKEQIEAMKATDLIPLEKGGEG